MKNPKKITKLFILMLLSFCMFKKEVSANTLYRCQAYQISSIDMKVERVKMKFDKKDIVTKKRTKGDLNHGKKKYKHVGNVIFSIPKKNILMLSEEGELSLNPKKISYEKMRKIIYNERKAYKSFLDENNLQPSKKSNEKYRKYLADECIKSYRVQFIVSDSGKLIFYQIYGIRYGEGRKKKK